MNKKKYPFIVLLPIAAILLEVMLFTVVSSQLIWEYDDINYGYSSPFYGSTMKLKKYY